MTGWGLGQLLTLPLPQEAPPPLVPPQPAASPTEEDKMPPYDEQTQAFIDGARQPGEGGDPARIQAPVPGPWNGPYLAPKMGLRWPQANLGRVGRPGRGVWGLEKPSLTLSAPGALLPQAAACLCHPRLG